MLLLPEFLSLALLKGSTGIVLSGFYIPNSKKIALALSAVLDTELKARQHYG